MNKILLLSTLIFLSSCAHSFMRGTVAKKISPKKAIVCLGENDVKIGDFIKFEQSECSSGGTNNITMHELATLGGSPVHTGYGQAQCELIYLGRGQVIKLINSHYSIVKIDSDFEFSESTQVEIVNE